MCSSISPQSACLVHGLYFPHVDAPRNARPRVLIGHSTRPVSSLSFLSLYAKMLSSFNLLLLAYRLYVHPTLGPCQLNMSQSYVTGLSNPFNISLIFELHLQPLNILTCFIFSLFRRKAGNLQAIFDSFHLLNICSIQASFLCCLPESQRNLLPQHFKDVLTRVPVSGPFKSVLHSYQPDPLKPRWLGMSSVYKPSNAPHHLQLSSAIVFSKLWVPWSTFWRRT